jgi:hypothetical protein
VVAHGVLVFSDYFNVHFAFRFNSVKDLRLKPLDVLMKFVWLAGEPPAHFSYWAVIVRAFYYVGHGYSVSIRLIISKISPLHSVGMLAISSKLASISFSFSNIAGASAISLALPER